MADVKISQLPAATTPLTGTEQIPLVQGGTTKQVTASGLVSNTNLGTPTAVSLVNATNVPVNQATGLLPVANGGTGTASPSLVQGSNVTITGIWPNQTISAATSTGTVSNVATGTGLTGGPITTTGTIALANTAVTPGAYTSANITVDAQGRITSAANGTSGGVTSVTGTAPVVSSGGTTPAISMAKATGSVDGYLSATDWTTFNNKGSGTVTSVTGTAPIVSSGGTTPALSMAAANTSTNGYLTSTDWNTFNNKQPAGSYLTNGGALGTPSSGTATNLTGLPLSTGVTGTLPVANGGTGTATPALVAGTNVTITGTWPNQTINSTGGGSGMVYPGAGIPNSTGSAWGTSYSTTGAGDVVLSTSPTLVTPVLGTPTSGNFSTGTFTWPTFNQNTTGTAANVTGIVAIANGGTNASDAATARTNLAVAGTGVSNTFTANQIVSVTDNTNPAVRITQLGTGNALLVEDSANPDSTPTVIDASGRVIIGNTTSVGNGQQLQTVNADTAAYRASTTVAPSITLARARGTIASPTGMSANDSMGKIVFGGYSTNTAGYITDPLYTPYIGAVYTDDNAFGGTVGAYLALYPSDKDQGTGPSVNIKSQGLSGYVLLETGQLSLSNSYKEGVATYNTSTAKTIDLNAGTVQIATLTGNCTFTFPTPVAGQSFTMLLKQDGTGSRTVTWPSSVKWPASTAPTITSTASKGDKFVFTCDGTYWWGSNAGQNYL